MKTVSQAVESVIKVKPFVVEALCEGLINISSLARQIHPTVEKLTGKNRITSYNVCYTKLLR